MRAFKNFRAPHSSGGRTCGQLVHLCVRPTHFEPRALVSVRGGRRWCQPPAPDAPGLVAAPGYSGVHGRSADRGGAGRAPGAGRGLQVFFASLWAPLLVLAQNSGKKARWPGSGLGPAFACRVCCMYSRHALRRDQQTRSQPLSQTRRPETQPPEQVPTFYLLLLRPWPAKGLGALL